MEMYPLTEQRLGAVDGTGEDFELLEESIALWRELSELPWDRSALTLRGGSKLLCLKSPWSKSRSRETVSTFSGLQSAAKHILPAKLTSP